MNAYELADDLNGWSNHWLSNYKEENVFKEHSNMLRQQADCIAELEKSNNWFRSNDAFLRKIFQDQNKRIADLEKQLEFLEDKCVMVDNSAIEHWGTSLVSKKDYLEEQEKTSAELRRLIDATPQTKPLSDEEILPIYTKFSTYDSESRLFVDIYGFARAIEKRHGIK